jgi:hypothetical protein
MEKEKDALESVDDSEKEEFEDNRCEAAVIRPGSAGIRRSHHRNRVARI